MSGSSALASSTRVTCRADGDAALEWRGVLLPLRRTQDVLT